ncbi:hypothetical protein FRE64_03270 [Euhalothece natronophila Z-M001]|uniref:Uncharacterized protein n=1 Tax=Euhalothece natronophila Z-M001 TaxID=522448 RepID=A0A5B8NL80_9CHRO|nr:type V CRISPR-associated protein Cas12k [Euhalothece natronophila]QDZ39040.1 hypothetical protein FRE64_03270 [Euhalothece natronophila Z-M001]
MSQITIQCRLVASEDTRHQLWQLMAQQNTPLINELLKQVAEHPEFETWRQKGKLPGGIVSQLCKPLKEDSRFIGQPARFYTSATKLVEYIYQSWLALQQRLQWRLNGQKRWLEILKSDQELCTQAECSLKTLRHQASEILASLQPSTSKSKKKSKKQKNSYGKSLFDAHDNAEDSLTRSAIAYLLKNNCKLPKEEEDPEKFAQRRRKAEIKVERLTKQIESSLPKGRDLTGEQWLETLLTAANTVPKDKEQFKSWQNILLTKPKSVPFPISYETNEDLTWSKNEKGRLCVRFSGLSKQTFQIYCDQRQLKWFQRFYEDQETKRASKKHHSSSLFTLRSARILWQEGTAKGQPWQINYLTLQCTVDTRLWTAEGTEQVKQEKSDEITKILTNMEEKDNLTQTQEAFIKRKQTTRDRLKHSYPRPSKPLYQGQPHLLLGVAFRLEKPATIAIVDGTTGKAITYRSIKQLLGENYKLLNRQRQTKKKQSHQRHKNQKKFATNQLKNSELGEYIDHLIAKAIVKVAQTYQVGSIVLPKLENLRELIQTEVKMRAEQKVPGYLEGQKQYAKQYRIEVHQWSYGRLIEQIKTKANQGGITIEQNQQTIRGSPQEEAKEIAILAYQAR